MLAWLGNSMIPRGSGNEIAKKSYSFVNFRGGVSIFKGGVKCKKEVSI